MNNEIVKKAFLDELQKISMPVFYHGTSTERAAIKGGIDSKYITKTALHPLMELSMAGAEVGSLAGAAIAIPIHRPGKLKDSLLEKAEISAVAGAAVTPIAATIIHKLKGLKFK